MAGPSSGRERWSTRAVAATLAGAATVAIVTTSCSAASDPEPTAADYVARLETICAKTVEQLDALPTPSTDVTVTEFSTQASVILGNEAEQIRSAKPPADLEDDHRALIRNDEEQAGSWADLAGTAGGDDALFAEITTRIAELTLGRNDLVAEMGAPGCVRQPR